jgi:AraC-like DNA-binding protein
MGPVPRPIKATGGAVISSTPAATGLRLEAAMGRVYPGGMSHRSPQAARTALTVRRHGPDRVEIIEGERRPWRFRPHIHAGDEIVRLLAGRARLRLKDSAREVEAGETIRVPAGAVHCFEPIDAEGWAFASRFVSRPGADATMPGRICDALGLKAQALLADRPSLETDVEAIAGACAVSAGHLSRVFRRETGTSLHHFHVLLALQKAKARLRALAPIVEAALDAGFYDQAHLTREFVRTLGMTPGTFRSAWLAAA